MHTYAHTWAESGPHYGKLSCSSLPRRANAVVFIIIINLRRNISKEETCGESVFENCVVPQNCLNFQHIRKSKFYSSHFERPGRHYMAVRWDWVLKSENQSRTQSLYLWLRTYVRSSMKATILMQHSSSTTSWRRYCWMRPSFFPLINNCPPRHSSIPPSSSPSSSPLASQNPGEMTLYLLRPSCISGPMVGWWSCWIWSLLPVWWNWSV